MADYTQTPADQPHRIVAAYLAQSRSSTVVSDILAGFPPEDYDAHDRPGFFSGISDRSWWYAAETAGRPTSGQLWPRM